MLISPTRPAQSTQRELAPLQGGCERLVEGLPARAERSEPHKAGWCGLVRVGAGWCGLVRVGEGWCWKSTEVGRLVSYEWLSLFVFAMCEVVGRGTRRARSGSGDAGGGSGGHGPGLV